MKFIKISHVLAVIMLFIGGLLATSSVPYGMFAYWTILIGYFLVVAGLFRGKIWSIRVSIIPPAIIFLLSAPMVLYNCYAFITGHTLYKDSPATIFVVAIYAIIFTLPSFLVLMAYWRHRHAWLPR
jgi:hypothetical protein